MTWYNLACGLLLLSSRVLPRRMLCSLIFVHRWADLWLVTDVYMMLKRYVWKSFALIYCYRYYWPNQSKQYVMPFNQFKSEIRFHLLQYSQKQIWETISLKRILTNMISSAFSLHIICCTSILKLDVSNLTPDI